jgi:hypothetical protein
MAQKKNFYFNFKDYNLAKSKEWVYTIWWTYRLEVSYNILWLEVLNEVSILAFHLAFNRSYFKVVLMENTLKTLGVKIE